MLRKVTAVLNTRISGMNFNTEIYLPIARSFADQPLKALASISVQIAKEAKQKGNTSTLGKFVFAMRVMRAKGNQEAEAILKIIFPKEKSISDKFILKEDLKFLRKMIHTGHISPDLDSAVASLFSYIAALQSPDMAHARQALEYTGKISKPIRDLIDLKIGVPGFTESVFQHVDSFDTFVKDKFTSLEDGIYYATLDDSLFLATKAMIADNNVEFIPIVNSSTNFHYEAGIRRDELLRYLYSLNARGDSDISEQLDVYKKLYANIGNLIESVSSLQEVLKKEDLSFEAASKILDVQQRILDEMQTEINTHAQKIVSSSHSTVRDFMLWKEANEPRAGKHYSTTLRTSLNDLDFLSTMESLASLPVLDMSDRLVGVITNSDLAKNSVRINLVDTQETPYGAESRQISTTRDHHAEQANNSKSQSDMSVSRFDAVGAAVSIVMNDLGRALKPYKELYDLYLLTSIDDTDDYDLNKVRTTDQEQFVKAIHNLYPSCNIYEEFDEIPGDFLNKLLNSYIEQKKSIKQDYITRWIKTKVYEELFIDAKILSGFLVVDLKLNDYNYKLFKQSDIQQWLTNEYAPQHPEIEKSVIFVSTPDSLSSAEPLKANTHLQRYDEVYLYAKNPKEIPKMAKYFINNIKQADKQPFPVESRSEYFLVNARSPVSAAQEALIEKTFPEQVSEIIVYIDSIPFFRQEIQADFLIELNELFKVELESDTELDGTIPFNPHVSLLRYSPVHSVYSRKKQITPILDDYKTK